MVTDGDENLEPDLAGFDLRCMDDRKRKTRAAATSRMSRTTLNPMPTEMCGPTILTSRSSAVAGTVASTIRSTRRPV